MFATFAMLHPYPVWKLFRGAVPERGPSEIRVLLWGGVASLRRYLMVLASAQLGARPERKGRRLHRPLQRFLVPTAGGVDEGWVDGHP